MRLARATERARDLHERPLARLGLHRHLVLIVVESCCPRAGGLRARAARRTVEDGRGRSRTGAAAREARGVPRGFRGGHGGGLGRGRTEDELGHVHVVLLVNHDRDALAVVVHGDLVLVVDGICRAYPMTQKARREGSGGMDDVRRSHWREGSCAPHAARRSPTPPCEARALLRARIRRIRPWRIA